MDASKWDAMRSQLVNALEIIGADIYTRDALGAGEWIDDAGEVIREESVTYVASVDDNSIPELQEHLAHIARKYMQDAIALLVGNSILVKGA
jgi:hypothetical protein